jgi:beta-lactam-binding protein with PASTA domain
MASGLSALGRLATVIVLAAAFLFGMAGVVYMSLQGKEVQVPEITGKALTDGERELALLGLKVKKRADRFSPDAAGTVIEQLPKAGETVKTGQMILVVTSKGPGEGDQPSSLKNTTEEDDSEKIEEMLTEKPKKPKANSNTNRKKADTARDVNAAGDTTSDSNSDGPPSNSKAKEPGANTVDRPNRNTQSPPPARTPNPPGRTEPKTRQQ